MQEAAAVRGAALEAIDDVEPAPLRERIARRIEDGSMAPGVLAVLSARAASDGTGAAGDGHGTGALPEATFEAVVTRGAGVQLIYEGLRLTRTLAQTEPWNDEEVAADAADPTVAANGHGRIADGSTGGEATDGETTASDGTSDASTDDPDMAILVADVLVARGFYMLARTEAAAAAVSVVQSFGRDQTVRRTTGNADLDRNLEADVFELAAVAGTTAVGADPTPGLREYVGDLARTDDPLPLADGLFSPGTVDRLAELVPPDGAGVATSPSADH